MFEIPPGLERVDKQELWRIARLRKCGIGWPSADTQKE
jgi:hypothetical protein